MSKTALPILLWLMVLAGLILACGEEPAPDSGAAQPAEPPPAQRAAEPSAAREGGNEDLETIREVLREPDPFARVSRLASLLPTLDAPASGDIPALLRDVEFDLGAAESTLLLRFWSNHEPEAAFQWALYESSQSQRAAAIEVAVTLWASVDPLAAARDVAAFQRVPGPYASDVEIALVRGWFDSGDPGLPEYIESIGLGFSRQRAVATFTRRLTQRDGAQAAIAWANSIPEDNEAFKKDALRQTGSSVAMLDPLAAAAWCDRICNDGIATNLRAMVGQRWAAQDGPAAMDWISRAPADRENLWAVKSAFRGWWQSDPEGFRRWLDTRSHGPVERWLQPALEIYAAMLARKEPQTGLDWAARIEDDTSRERATVNVARVWRRADEAAAEAWLAKSSLSEEALEKVRHPQGGKMSRPRSAAQPEDAEPEAD